MKRNFQPQSVYQGGPMRGYDNFNFQAFENGKAFLEGLGIEVVSPHDIDMDEKYVEARFGHVLLPESRTYIKQFALVETTGAFAIEKAMRRDIAAILSVDAISFLPGWRESAGCIVEYTVATAIGLPVYEHDSATGQFNLIEEGSYVSCPT